MLLVDFGLIESPQSQPLPGPKYTHQPASYVARFASVTSSLCEGDATSPPSSLASIGLWRVSTNCFMWIWNKMDESQSVWTLPFSKVKEVGISSKQLLPTTVLTARWCDVIVWPTTTMRCISFYLYIEVDLVCAAQVGEVAAALEVSSARVRVALIELLAHLLRQRALIVDLRAYSEWPWEAVIFRRLETTVVANSLRGIDNR